jgi:Domain of unknown function (DUF4383)
MRTSTWTANRLLGSAFGAVYILVGLLGFTVSGGHGFAATGGGKLLGIFMVNPLHNVVHLLVGALLLAGAAGGEAAASRVNTLVGGVYLAVGVLGLFILTSSANIVALNSADNVLHFLSAAVLLGTGLAVRRPAARSHA